METNNKSKLRTGIFQDKNSAESAYDAAIKRGYKPEDINIFMSDDTRKKYYDSKIVTEQGDKSLEGLAIGGALGGTVLGVLGAVVALSSTIVIPGIGLVIAGPLAAGLAGAGAGSIAGGIVGGLIGAGIPEERAKIYEKGINEGGVVMGVNTPSDDETLIQDWKTHNGKDIY